MDYEIILGTIFGAREACNCQIFLGTLKLACTFVFSIVLTRSFAKFGDFAVDLLTWKCVFL